MQDTYETLAAVAVFRELYDQEKDIYDVLALYIKERILDNKLSSFTCAEITHNLNDTNSFKLGESVVKSALKRLGIPRENGRYLVPNTILEEASTDSYNKQRLQNENLFRDLEKYVETEQEKQLSVEQTEKLRQQFFDYIVGKDASGEYTLLISKYIMKVSLDSNYYEIINRIKEGTLIYEGICYSGNISELGKWSAELNIYFEMETLFYIVGYNGEVHKSLYHELLDYVNEINNRGNQKKKYISLWYTEAVEEEIELYFSTAENILKSGEVIDPTRKPMTYILDGAKSKSDVAQKKANFYRLLATYGIKIFKCDYYDEKNIKYSIVNKSVYEENQIIVSDREEEYVQKCTDKLNYIEILRKNRNIGLDRVKHILLTANSVILKLAYVDNMYKKGEVPKATDVDFLINRFWFKLNKGFGKGLTPRTMDIITRARIILSFIANDNVSKLYDDVRKRYERKEISREEATTLIATLREYSKTPDEIEGMSIYDDLEGLKDFDVNKKIEEMKREEIERQDDKKRIIAMEETISNLQNDKARVISQKDEVIQELKNEILINQNKSDQLEKQLNEMCKRQTELEEREHIRQQKKKQAKRLILLILISSLMAICVFFLLERLFKIEKSYSGIISIVLGILPIAKESLQCIYHKIKND